MSEVKVGDKLLFRSSYGVEILPVERITPSGRIKTRLYELNPDMTVRGKCDAWSSRPRRGELITPEKEQEILEVKARAQEVAYLVSKLTKYDWHQLGVERLRAIVANLDPVTQKVTQR